MSEPDIDENFFDNLFNFNPADDTQLTADPEFYNSFINEMQDPLGPPGASPARPSGATAPGPIVASPDDPNISQQEKLFKEARQEAIRLKLYNIPERDVVKIKKAKKSLSDCDAIIKNLKGVLLQANDLYENGEDIDFWNYTNYFLSAILGDKLLTQLDNCKDCSVINFKRLEHAYTKVFKRIATYNIQIKEYFINNKPLLTAKINQNFEYANDNLKKILTIFLLFLQIKVIYRDFEFPNVTLKIQNYEINDVQEHSYIMFSKKIENNREIAFQLILTLLKRFIPEWKSKSIELANAFKNNSKDFIQQVLGLKGKLPPPPILPKLPIYDPNDNCVLSETLLNYPQTKEERLQIIEKMNKMNIPINNRNMETFVNKNKDSDINRCIAIWNPQQKKGEHREKEKRCELKNVFIKMKLNDYEYFFTETFGKTIDKDKINEEFTLCNKHIKKIFGIHFIKNKDQKTFTATAGKDFAKGEIICRDKHLEIGSLIQVSLEKSNLKYTDDNYLETTTDIKKGDVLRKPERPIPQKDARVTQAQQEAYDIIYNEIKTAQENRRTMMQEKEKFNKKKRKQEEEKKSIRAAIKEKKSAPPPPAPIKKSEPPPPRVPQEPPVPPTQSKKSAPPPPAPNKKSAPPPQSKKSKPPPQEYVNMPQF